jgi:membrane carboxypeptidase/penicillin-binding protein PbpC
LNIPAVEVLDKVGYGSLYSLLRQSGISTLRKSPESYGLSLTLGSSGVTLLELTNAYAMLARLGVYKPYVLEEGENDQQGERIISDGAAYIVADILSDSSRLQEIDIYRNEKIMPKVAFKTGTSYGQRDAWAFAYNRDYTIGVWLGNFSGSPSKALVGIEASVPVAFKIFDWLYSNQTATWYDRPNSIGLRSSDDLFVKSSVLPASSVEFSDKDKPQIISPDSGAAYFLSGPQGTPQKLSFSARPGHGTSEFYWFLNGRLLSQASPGEKLFWPMKPGQYNLTCSDNFGRSSTAIFIVR